jgi:uncharacterized protein YoxC
MVDLGPTRMDTTPEKSTQMTPEEIVRKATAEVFAEPRDKRARVRRMLAQTPVVLEAVAQILTSGAEPFGELLKLGDEVVYRSLLMSWRLATTDQKSRLVAELHQSTSEQYRRLTLALAVGLPPGNFNDAVALIERVNPIIPLPEFARGDFPASARELLSKLQNSDLAEFRQRKLLTLVITSLRGRGPAQVALAIEVIKRLSASKIDPASFQSNGRKEWLAFLQELAPKERAEISAALLDADDRCRSVFWDHNSFGPIAPREIVAAPALGLEASTGKPLMATVRQDHPVSGEDLQPAGPTPSEQGSLPSEVIVVPPDVPLGKEEDAMRWLESLHGHMGALLSRLHRGASASARTAQLECELSEKTSEIGRLAAANEAAQRRIEAIDRARETACEAEKTLLASTRELAQQIKTLEDDNQRKDRMLADLTDARAELKLKVEALADENEQKHRRLAELSKEVSSLEQRIVEPEEGRLLYGDQKLREVKRALAERIGRELEDIPELADNAGVQPPEVIKVRFRRLLALLRENGILDPAQGAKAR